MPSIYEYVFDGISYGIQNQVHCCFHNDTNRSAGVSPEGKFNCFTCGPSVGAPNEEVFISKYFGVNDLKAKSIVTKLNDVDKYKYNLSAPTQDQLNYLQSIGINNTIANKYFKNQISNSRLLSIHNWNGYRMSCTWFNAPGTPAYNAGSAKYVYQGIIGGICVPYDDVQKYKRLLICEGEKDMYTAKSMGITSAVAKLGGAKTQIVAGVNFENKEVIICYDCDEAGYDGACKDAAYLMDKYACHVKVIQLGLNEHEDLNDYFVKYNHTLQDFSDLIKNTPEFVVPPQYKLSKVEKFLDSLNSDELQELDQKLKIKLNKGE